MADLPKPISNQDKYLRNIAVNDPDITEIEGMEPTSRQEEYLKYIALNGSSGGGGGADVNVVQTTGTSTINVMSQNAVTKELNKKVGTDTTVNGKPLSEDIELTSEDIGTYTKEEIERKIEESSGSDINVVQSKGTSETDVMSQKAVSENTCFGPNSSVWSALNVAIGDYASAGGGGYEIAIGKSAKSPNYFGVSLGAWAETTGDYSVSLGGQSKAPENSVVSVGDGSSNPDYGTRRIVNVKDPKNAQDAATKKYVDDKIEESGGSSVNIVQTKGTSETDVMSQKAVTDAIPTKLSDLEKDINYVINNANGNEQLAIGENSSTTYPGGIAIGKSAKSINDNISIGEEAKAQSNVSIITIGTNTNAEGSCSIAIGRETKTNVEGRHSVAIGSYSVAREPEVVSVGAGSDNETYATRRIVNVGDPINAQDAATKKYVDEKVASSGGSGVIIEQSTGESETSVMSQKAVTDSLPTKTSDLENDSKFISNNGGTSTATAVGTKSNGPYGGCTSFGYNANAHTSNSTAIGYNTDTYNDGVAIGCEATTGMYATSVGRLAKATGENSLALGHSTEVSNRYHYYSVALGSKSTTSSAGVVSVGDGSDNAYYGKRRIENVQDPINNQDAATKKYVDDKVAGGGGGSSINVVQTTGISETDVMSQNAVTNELDKCIINTATANEAMSINNAYTATKEGQILIGNQASGENIDTISIGRHSHANGMYSVSIGEGAGSENKGITIGGNSTGYSSFGVIVGNGSSTNNGVSIGNDATSRVDYGVAVGPYANAGVENDDYEYTVALGAYSKAEESNVVSVGSGENGLYCKTRRIVNVSDPINSQDVATKGYVNGTVLYDCGGYAYEDGIKSGTLTLNDSVNNYENIVLYGMSDLKSSVSLNMLIPPTGDVTGTLNHIHYVSSNIRAYLCYLNFTISDKKLTISYNSYCRIGFKAGGGELNPSDSLDMPTSSVLSINKIIGYNKRT